MSSSSQRDGWVRTSLVSMVWRRAITASLPLLSSSMRARAMEDGLGEEEGGGSGPNLRGGDGVDVEDVGEVCSGDLEGLGRRSVFLSQKEGWVKRPS